MDLFLQGVKTVKLNEDRRMNTWAEPRLEGTTHQSTCLQGQQDDQELCSQEHILFCGPLIPSPPMGSLHHPLTTPPEHLPFPPQN